MNYDIIIAMTTATALAHPNIAFIKYWGNRDDALRLPVNGSISMNLDGLHARTQVTFDPALPADRFVLNGAQQAGPGLQRVRRFFDVMRALAGSSHFAFVESENNFPTGAGIASSAAAFAALSLAASAAAGLSLSEAQLSRLARLGSGSAARSVPGGFVEWQMGSGDADSVAYSVAPPGYWELVDCVAIVQAGEKRVGSTQGHALAGSSPLQAARVADAPRRLEICRRAILERDFGTLAEVVEQDSNMMHAVMMTSHPALFYWEPASLDVMRAVREWRATGRPVCYTLDAGPNVHVLAPAVERDWLEAALRAIPGVQGVLAATPGGPARLVG